MSSDTDNSECFQLVFEGTRSSGSEDMRKLKLAMVAELGLSVDEIREIFESAPVPICTAKKEEELQKALDVLERSGAIVRIEAPRASQERYDISDLGSSLDALLGDDEESDVVEFEFNLPEAEDDHDEEKAVRDKKRVYNLSEDGKEIQEDEEKHEDEDIQDHIDDLLAQLENTTVIKEIEENRIDAYQRILESKKQIENNSPSQNPDPKPSVKEGQNPLPEKEEESSRQERKEELKDSHVAQETKPELSTSTVTEPDKKDTNLSAEEEEEPSLSREAKNLPEPSIETNSSEQKPESVTPSTSDIAQPVEQSAEIKASIAVEPENSKEEENPKKVQEMVPDTSIDESTQASIDELVATLTEEHTDTLEDSSPAQEDIADPASVNALVNSLTESSNSTLEKPEDALEEEQTQTTAKEKQLEHLHSKGVETKPPGAVETSISNHEPLQLATTIQKIRKSIIRIGAYRIEISFDSMITLAFSVFFSMLLVFLSAFFTMQ